MNILFISSAESKSGGARQALYLARGMQSRGHDVLFFVPEKSKLPELDPELAWRFLPASRHLWRKTVEEALLPRAPAVVHAYHNRALKKLAWWGLAWHRLGIATVAHRGICKIPHTLPVYWSPGIDCFTPNSEACAGILKRIGVGRQRLAVMSNAVPLERTRPKRARDEVRRELGLAENQIVIGSVLNTNPEKGGPVLLRAFAGLKPLGVKLVLVGVPAETWLPLATELGIEKETIFVPYTECVADYLQTFDMFVLPSMGRLDSQPNTLLEAIIFGLPVVASDMGGVAETLKGNGLLVPPGDVERLAQALRQVATDSAMRRTLATGSSSMNQDFLLESKLERMEALYADLLSRHATLESQSI